MAAFFVTTIFWPSLWWLGLLLVFGLGFPAAWIFDVVCYRCHWPLLVIYGTAPDKYAKDQFLALTTSREVWSPPAYCSKCHARFVDP